MTTTYTISSAKQTETLSGTLADAIARARAIDGELQPAYGVSVELPSGDLVLTDVSSAAAHIIVEAVVTRDGERSVDLAAVMADGSIVRGRALYCRDSINGGWMPAGDHLDAWLAWSGDVPDAVTRAVVDLTAATAEDGDVVDVDYEEATR